MSKLVIRYLEGSEAEFKKKFLVSKSAILKIYSRKSNPKFKEWKRISFKNNSSVTGNLYSGYLRHWKEKKIYKVKIGCFF